MSCLHLYMQGSSASPGRCGEIGGFQQNQLSWWHLAIILSLTSRQNHDVLVPTCRQRPHHSCLGQQVAGRRRGQPPRDMSSSACIFRPAFCSPLHPWIWYSSVVSYPTQPSNSIIVRVSKHNIDKKLLLKIMIPISGNNLLLFTVLLIGTGVNVCESFISVATTSVNRSSPLQAASLPQQTALTLEQDKAYAKSFDLVDECAASGRTCDQLFDAVRYIDKNALKLYPDESAKMELWDRAHGSWRLSLATGGGKYTTFKPIPIFAYAMIDNDCFGNGIGFNENAIILSLLGPHYFNVNKRQMGIGIEEVFLFSKKVTPLVPGFMADGMNLGMKPDDYLKKEKSRMPTFTIIGASSKSLIARGGTGGIAIWTKLENDIRPAAYGGITISK